VGVEDGDTQWESEEPFRATEARFAELVTPHAPVGVDVLDALHAVERIDIATQGYGAKAFTLSMVRAAISMTDGAVPTDVIRELVDLGAAMLVEPVHLLPDVPAVLEQVGKEIRLVMITKGDLVHQTRKVTTSGLEHHFSDIDRPLASVSWTGPASDAFQSEWDTNFKSALGKLNEAFGAAGKDCKTRAEGTRAVLGRGPVAM